MANEKMSKQEMEDEVYDFIVELHCMLRRDKNSLHTKEYQTMLSRIKELSKILHYSDLPFEIFRLEYPDQDPTYIDDDMERD